MPVSAIRSHYYGERPQDAVENFHGNLLVYVAWDQHLLFSYPAAFALSPMMPFEKLMEHVLASVYAGHPDYAGIQWSQVHWLLNNQPWTPALQLSLADNGVSHKSVIRFHTPGSSGLGPGF